MRAFHQLEPPADDEGFASIDHVPFARAPGRGIAGAFVAATAVGRTGWAELLADGDLAAPHLVFDWRPDGSPTDIDEAAAAVAQVASGQVEHAICPHPGGAPTCWCRPPLPGLPLAFAHVDTISISRALSFSVRARRTGRSRPHSGHAARRSERGSLEPVGPAAAMEHHRAVGQPRGQVVEHGRVCPTYGLLAPSVRVRLESVREDLALPEHALER